MRKLTSVVGLAVFVVLVATACAGDDTEGGGKRSLLESIPADTALLASVRIKQAVEDMDIQTAFAAFAEAAKLDSSSLNEALFEVDKRTGLNPAQIDELLLVGSQELFDDDAEGTFREEPPRPVVITALVPHSSGEGTPPIRVIESHSGGREEGPFLGGSPDGLLLFAKGSYDPDLVTAAIEQEIETPLTAATFNGQEIITGEANAALAFLQDDLIVIGSERSVQAVIDVRAGDKPALEGDFLDAFRDMGNPLAKMLIKVPEEAREGLDLEDTEDLPIRIDPSIFLVQSLGLILDKTGDEISVSLSADYPDITSARKARDAVTGLVAFLNAFIVGVEVGELLDKMEVSFSGSQLSIDLSLSAEELKEAIEALQSSDA